MYKLLLAACCLFSFTTSQAQIPTGYYNNAYNGAVPKTCAELKTALFNILSTDTTYVAYNSADGSFDSQDAVNAFDVHRNDVNTGNIIWDMYTDNPTGPELYTFNIATDQCGGSFPPQVGACYNREHAFPRAWFGDNIHIRGDLHNIFATDGESNSRHANFPYGDVINASWLSPAGAKFGSSSSIFYNGNVFEVIDAYKGDFARVMFYMVTAYESSMPAWQSLSSADSVLDGTTWPSLDNWAIRQWYKWHVQDPVSQKEIARNDSIYRVQHNRNPFVDHPEYVQLIWSCTNVLPVTLTDITAVKNNETVWVKWNVSMETNAKQYEVERSIDGVSFNKVGLVAAQNKPTYSFGDDNLLKANTLFYRVKMVDIDGRFTYSKIVSVKINNKAGAVTIFPNPAANEITVSLHQPMQNKAVVKITDVAGKELMKQDVIAAQNNIKLKVSTLPAGKYLLFIISGDNVIHDSFIIVK
jgi:endonuclease I